MNKVNFCPNGEPISGSYVLGYVKEGKLLFFDEEVKVDRDLSEIFKNKEKEFREFFRFSHPCRKSSCKHWKDKCSITSSFQTPVISNELKVLYAGKCVIQDRCQWFKQK